AGAKEPSRPMASPEPIWRWMPRPPPNAVPKSQTPLASGTLPGLRNPPTDPVIQVLGGALTVPNCAAAGVAKARQASAERRTAAVFMILLLPAAIGLAADRAAFRSGADPPKHPSAVAARVVAPLIRARPQVLPLQ